MESCPDKQSLLTKPCLVSISSSSDFPHVATTYSNYASDLDAPFVSSLRHLHSSAKQTIMFWGFLTLGLD